MPAAKLLPRSFMEVFTGVHGEYGTYFQRSIKFRLFKWRYNCIMYDAGIDIKVPFAQRK
jgi:hypothetical protein